MEISELKRISLLQMIRLPGVTNPLVREYEHTSEDRYLRQVTVDYQGQTYLLKNGVDREDATFYGFPGGYSSNADTVSVCEVIDTPMLYSEPDANDWISIRVRSLRELQ